MLGSNEMYRVYISVINAHYVIILPIYDCKGAFIFHHPVCLHMKEPPPNTALTHVKENIY